MDAETKAALYDVKEACQIIADFIEGSTLANYSANLMLKSAVERQFITIGEALNRAIRQKPELREVITDTRKIIDFRNFLTHSYFSISDKTVWEVVHLKLPTLLQEVTALLEDTAPGTKTE